MKIKDKKVLGILVLVLLVLGFSIYLFTRPKITVDLTNTPSTELLIAGEIIQFDDQLLTVVDKQFPDVPLQQSIPVTESASIIVYNEETQAMENSSLDALRPGKFVVINMSNSTQFGGHLIYVYPNESFRPNIGGTNVAQ